ncbi:MAG: VC0807 family protein [Myxococcota bacterium]
MNDSRWAWLEIGCTVVAPVVVLTFGTTWLSPSVALGVALVAPVGFALVSMAREGRPSGLALFALASVLLTGVIGLFDLEPRWFALKEAAVPAGMGAVIAGTAATDTPLVGLVLARILDPARTRAAVEAGDRPAYDRAIRRATLWLGAVTAASGIANFALATALVHSGSGTDAFAAELGRYTGWSFPLIGLPTMGAAVVVLRRTVDAVELAVRVPFDSLLRDAHR